MRRLAWVLLGAAACTTVGPDYERPEIQTADAWHQELTGGMFQGESDLASWWTVLNDPTLNSLIDRAGHGNLDLKIALARIMEARAQLKIAGADRLPDLNAFGGGARVRFSADNPIIPPPVAADNTSIFAVGVDAAWEIDVWGRIDRQVDAATGNFQASIEDRRDVRVTLYSEVALNYVGLRALQERRQIAESNVETQRSSLQLAQSRFDAGLTSELDVKQAETNLATTEARIPRLDQGIVLAINRLGVLVGQQPHTLHKELAKPKPIPLPPERIMLGVPANLLRQRPDIRSSERRLAAQTARIGVATADLYPRFSIAGSFGWVAEDVGDLFGSSSRAFSIGVPFQWNVFDGGRIRANIKVQDARTEALLAAYEQSVLLALEEVEGAMTSYALEQVRRDALQRAAESASRAAELSRDLYTKGLTDFQNVLDTERSKLEIQDLHADSRGRVTDNVIRLYKALGGGWWTEEEDETTSEEGAEKRTEPDKK